MKFNPSRRPVAALRPTADGLRRWAVAGMLAEIQQHEEQIAILRATIAATEAGDDVEPAAPASADGGAPPMTAKEIATHLGLHTTTVQWHGRQGNLTPAGKKAHSTLFTRASVDALAARIGATGKSTNGKTPTNGTHLADPPNGHATMTAAEAATRLGITQSGIYYQVEHGKLKAAPRRPGQAVRILTAAVEAAEKAAAAKSEAAG